MSVPSIPSRYLTPVFDTQPVNTENDEDICKMSRLFNDPSKVGPGSYQIIEDQTRKAPKATILWNRSRSTRESALVEPFNNTQQSVGPGSYTVKGQFYKPMQAFFARDGLKAVKVKSNVGTIRHNFEQIEDDSEDEMRNRKTSPGPGAYHTMTSSFNLSPDAERPKSI